MPIITFQNKKLVCESGENLRTILLRNQVPPYNGAAKLLNCHGLGTCGTCAVEIKGAVSQKTPVEKWRLNFPPHKEENDLRLACQCKVLGDLDVKKHEGFWGEHVSP
jgi:ferredoxin